MHTLGAGHATEIAWLVTEIQMLREEIAELRRELNPPRPQVPAARTMAFENLVIDFDSRQVTTRDRTIAPARREFDILAYLARNAGRICTFDELTSLGGGTSSRPALAEHVRRIRQTVRIPGLIRSAHGIGYQLGLRPLVDVEDVAS